MYVGLSLRVKGQTISHVNDIVNQLLQEQEEESQSSGSDGTCRWEKR